MNKPAAVGHEWWALSQERARIRALARAAKADAAAAQPSLPGLDPPPAAGLHGSDRGRR